MGAWSERYAVSMEVGKRPGAPVQTGRRPLRNDVIAVVGGLILYVVFVKWAHLWLIGVPPMP